MKSEVNRHNESTAVETGSWLDDVREGYGKVIYCNNDTIEGHFLHGQPHGTVVYTFAGTGKIKYARYENGTRIEWINLKHRNRAVVS